MWLRRGIVAMVGGHCRAFEQRVGVVPLLVEGGHCSDDWRPVVRGRRVQVHRRRHPRRRRRLVMVRIPPSIREITPVHWRHQRGEQ